MRTVAIVPWVWVGERPGGTDIGIHDIPFLVKCVDVEVSRYGLLSGICACSQIKVGTTVQTSA